MISAIKTDHSAIVIELQDVEDKVKGPGFWKLNCSLLNDTEYVNELNLLLPTWLQEGKQDLGDPQSVWDWVKYRVKKYSRWYSINKCKLQNLEEQQLNRQFQEATTTYQNCPTQENLSALNVLKEKLEHLYDKKVEGIIVRWDFLEKCLEKFNFGPDFTRWVHIFYNDVQNCVINNGLCSHYFHISCGVSRGIPSLLTFLSPNGNPSNCYTKPRKY